MCPDSSILEYLNSVYIEKVFGFLTFYTQLKLLVMKWITSCLLSRQRDSKCRQKKSRFRLRQSKDFFPLSHHAIVGNHVVPPGICAGLIVEVFD